MENFWISLLGGGFVGASTLALLFKLFIQNQLTKSQKEFQHLLDNKSLQLKAELEIFAESKKDHTISYQQRKVLALEACYALVISTSLPRHKFRKNSTNSLPQGTVEEQNAIKYYDLFKENFAAFTRAFESITDGFIKLEDVAIYVDQELETKVANSLRNINLFYAKNFALMKKAHRQSHAHLDGKGIKSEHVTFDFSHFFDSMVQEWNVETIVLRQKLKDELRKILNPNSGHI